MNAMQPATSPSALRISLARLGGHLVLLKGFKYMDYVAMLKKSVLFACTALGSRCVASAQQAENSSMFAMKIERTIEHRYAKTSVQLNIYNPETDFPCLQIQLSTLENAEVLESKELCVFPDRQGRLFDVRTDVSFVDYQPVSLTGEGLSFTADVSLKESDAFLLNCELPVTPFKLGSLECVWRELP